MRTAVALPLLFAMMVVSGCGADADAPPTEADPSASASLEELDDLADAAESAAADLQTSRDDATAPADVMPDLVGLPSAEAGARLAGLGLTSDWGRPVVVRCQARPRSVVRQRPAPGTPVSAGTRVQVRTAVLDLDRFRGPCPLHDQHVGPVALPDADVAGRFYRFAADPSLGAPFARSGVWVGIEDGPTAVVLGPDEVADLESWELTASGYAEQLGPFSPLDTLAASGGHYELRSGVVGTCPHADGHAPDALRGLRAISLTAPADVASACPEWWGVTLFLDVQGRIKGVALRLGSP